ncbi:MAG: CoA transferase [Streptosporangiales bacterium]|nr:CoA transferase [Streptosporangiales bacterium]
MAGSTDNEAPGRSAGPLAGLRVLDISTVYAAPFAASLLADLGADVVKVELPGSGDPLRGMEPFDGEESLSWASLTRNKRCVTLDLRREQGQEILLKLLAGRDVLFENFRPGTLDRWGLEADRLRAANPDLVIIRVSGYGQTGPYRAKAGFGTPATAFSGYAYITGYPDRPPVLPPVSLTDYVTGMFAAIGALSALYHRDALGGQGQEIDVALYESMFRLLESVVAGYDRLGQVRERSGNQMSASVPAGMFGTADGRWMVLTTSTDRTFNRLAPLMGRPDMLTDPRYATNRARVEHRDEVNAIVGEWFAGHSAEEIQRRCDEDGVPVSPVLSVADAFAEPHYAARDMIVEVDHPKLGRVRLPGVVPKFSSTPGAVRNAGPGLGQHNHEVYGELGLDEADLARLSDEGVI